MADDTDFGACVVVIPESTDLPENVEGGHHITLAYFGDEALPETDYQSLLKSVYDLSKWSEGIPQGVVVENEEFFGENEEAHVLTLDPSPNSTPVVLRDRLLATLSPSLKEIFKTSETYPVYQPHMTLGYTDEGHDPETLDEVPDYLVIEKIALWNGENRVEFPFGGELAHYGTPRKSGRYPWGSGGNPNQRNKSFLDRVDELKKQGMSETQIARGFDVTTTQLRALKQIAKTEVRQANMAQAYRMKEKGMSNTAIGAAMGLNESSVRALLDPSAKQKADVLGSTVNMLKEQVDKKGFIDYGAGVETHLKISSDKLRTAVAVLHEEGYKTYYVKVQQLGTGKETTIKVLGGPDTTWTDVGRNPEKIKTVYDITSDDGGRTFFGIQKPLDLSDKRLAVRYAEEGGGDADGVIYLRPGVKDLSLDGANYAQVRISVNGTHYLKGMAMYKHDLPDGVDVMFNTNKSDTGNKLDALKKQKDDPDNPFGAVIRQIGDRDVHGRVTKVTSVANLVNEEGDWDRWSKSLSSQMLSKQSSVLAKKQLDLKYEGTKAEYDEIMSLTNPAVRKKLLESFADSADAAAVHLKAKALPGQATHVILPINSLKDNEIYAPKYDDGDSVVLIRYPHGGVFEIPELRVNNRHPEARAALGQAKDAVGINSKVAARLSGADFDGDTVLVIPNNNRQVKTSPPLKGLKDFDPQAAYPYYPGMKVMRDKQKQMGDVSNLITDMTIKGASEAELARAVRHSMVVIDAEKHKLNYKQSYLDNGIRDLKEKYQDGARSGASTLISKSTSNARVPERELRKARDGGPIDKETGRKVYVETGGSYTDSKGRTVQRTSSVARGELVRDAHELSSGTRMETVYANHANRMRDLGDSARKAMVNTPNVERSSSAAKTYAYEVSTLNAKLNDALKNKPQERQAQLLANQVVASKRQANPDMSKEEIKKIKSQALAEARSRVGARKVSIDITPDEWNAIQAGALSNTKLNQILDNTDVDKVKELATPRTTSTISPGTLARAKTMLSAGYTQAEIARALGIPTSTLNDNLGKES